MNRKFLAGAALAAAAMPTPALADRPPSAHIQCDGLPDNVTAGETAARLVGAVTLLGLFAPAHETPDMRMRLSGADGVRLCTDALNRESNDTRRAQLILARAVHHMETGDNDAAIADARLVETDRPAFAASRPFRLSFHLSALEIEAQALLAAGRAEEAIGKAMEMADAAPYDIPTQLRAARYVRLSPAFGDAQRLFYDRLIRIYPSAILDRAMQHQLHGDFAAAAADYELWMRLVGTILDRPDMASLAQTALLQALAGNAARAQELAAQARDAIQGDPGSTSAAPATEVLDLYQIWENAHEGRAPAARILFANRSAWLRPSGPSVSAVARLLQQGAQPSELIGSLEGDPGRFRAAMVDRWRRDLLDEKNRYTAIRAFHPQSNYDRFSANAWRVNGSRYAARSDDSRFKARSINVSRDGGGAPANYALLLHAALTAQAAGKPRFMLMPAQSNTAAAFVRFGDSGEQGMIDAMSFEADRVIRDLGPIIPRTVAR